MDKERINDKINDLIDYKELINYYEVSQEMDENDAKRVVMDQLDSEIDFYLHIAMEQKANVSLLN